MAITDPTDIAGCVAWLNPGSITASDGDPIGSWSDETVNGNDATSVGSDRPTYRDGTAFFHAKPTLEFSSQAHRLEIAAAASLDNANATYAIVCQLTDVEGHPDPKWIFNKDNTNPATVGLRVADENIADEGLYNGFFRLNGTEGTPRDLVSRGPVRNAWTVLLFRYDGSTGELYVDNDLSDSLSIAGSLDTDNSGKLVIGNHPTVDNAFEGHIGDVVVYNNAISNTDRDDLISWLIAKYKNTEYTKTGTVLTTGIREVRVRSAADTGESTNQLLSVTTTGAINHYTSPTGDPHNWTLANSNIIPTDASYRTIDFIKVSSTWYVYVDRATANGEIELWTGSSLSSLTEHASSPVITGGAGDFQRSPAVIESSGSWTMLIDVRTTSITGGTGYLDRWTSSDGISWTKDAVNSPVVSPIGQGFEGTDITHPMILPRSSGGYLIVYAGYNSDHPLVPTIFPHEIGLLTSNDLITFTRSNQNPILTMDQGASDFDVAFVANPCLFSDGSNLTLYYTGQTMGGTYQPGYATGPADTGIVRSAAHTFLSASTVELSTFVLAVGNTFSYTAAIGLANVPVTAGNAFSLNSVVTSNHVILDIVNAFNFTSESGYNQEFAILQYIGFTGPRVLAECSNFFGYNGRVAEATIVDVVNSFDWEPPHNNGIALTRIYNAANTFGLVANAVPVFIHDASNIFSLSSNVDSSSSTYGRDESTGIIKQNLTFSVSGGNSKPEKEYSPFTGSSTPGFAAMPTKPVIGESTVQLTYPRVSPTTTLTLRNPEWGSNVPLSWATISRSSRGNTSILYSDPIWPQTERMSVTLTGICTPTKQAFIDFLNESLGKEVGFRDWENRNWKGVIVPSETTITDQLDRYTVQLTFQGQLV